MARDDEHVRYPAGRRPKPQKVTKTKAEKPKKVTKQEKQPRRGKGEENSS